MMPVGTLASPTSCRDNGRCGTDEGALCLSGVGVTGQGYHETPTESQPEEDKHQAPTLPHIDPLSLQSGDLHLVSFPFAAVKIL